MKSFCLKMPEELHGKIKALADERKIDMSEYMREAIIEKVKREAPTAVVVDGANDSRGEGQSDISSEREP